MIRFATLGVLLASLGVLRRDPGTSGPETQTVSISRFAFAPAEMTVRVGDTVMWRNHDAFVHTTAADSGAWSSGDLQQDHRFTFVPDRAGRFAYHCAAHPVMRGILNVRQ